MTLRLVVWFAFQPTEQYFPALNTAYHTKNQWCYCSCSDSPCFEWDIPYGKQQFHIARLKAHWSEGGLLAWLMHASWCLIWADTITSDPVVLYCWCRVAVFQLQLLDQHLLLVCWEVRVYTRSWGVPSTICRSKQTQRYGGKRMLVVYPQNSSCFRELYLCWVCLELAPMSSQDWISTCFMFCRCWVSGGQHPAAGSGWHGVTSCCASVPCCAVRRRVTHRKLCCPVVTVQTWRLCWKGPSQLTA